MHIHEFKLDRQSLIVINGANAVIDVYKCQVCKGIRIIETKTGKSITVDGKMGEEI